MRTKPMIKLTQEAKADIYVERKMNYAFYQADFWEIVLPSGSTGGAVEISVDGRKRTLLRGTLAFFAPDVKRRITVRGEGGEYHSIRLKSEVVKEVLDTFDKESYNAFSTLDVYVINIDELHISNILRGVQEVHIAEDADRETLLKKLCFTILLPLVPFRTYNEGKDITQRALAVMNDPRNVSFRLPDVADKVGCSEEYLVRCFKKSGLETPNTIFKRIKLRYAKSVLTTQKISVSEVATLIGFRSVGHFNKLYYTEYGVCPGTDKTR